MKWVCLLCIPLFGFADWAQEALDRMTLEEKIGQLFVAPACPLRGDDHWEDWVELIDTYHLGGALLKQGDSENYINFLKKMQERSRVPMLVLADAEWGLGMRMSDGAVFPRNGTLGEEGDLEAIREMGKEVGRDCKKLGIHMNLSPVADVNNNPENRVIGSRSFGDDPKKVADCVSAMVAGLQEGGVMACAKHFPGHGDTSVDSHFSTPLIVHDRAHLNAVELPPFIAAIEQGVDAILTAHILCAALDRDWPATFSYPIVTELLREELGFKGLVVSDALNMKALLEFTSPEEIGLLAHKAGCDLLLYGDHLEPGVDYIMRCLIPENFERIKKNYEGRDTKNLDEKVLRILRAKSRCIFE